MANTALNRTTIALLTNKSGGSLAYGAVVILDNTNAKGFTTTTTAALATRAIGVVIERNGIANDATGQVAVGGWCPQVTLNTAATVGQFITTHTVAGQGTPHSSPQVTGTFGVALQASATPEAILFGSPHGPGQVADGDKGDITVSASGATWTIDNDVVTPAKMNDGAAVSVLGRSANSSGDRADIAASANGMYLHRASNALAFTAIGYPVFIRKASYESLNSSTALQADDTLVLPVGASESWVFEFHVIYLGNTTGDFRCGLTFPTTPTEISYYIFGAGTDAAASGSATSWPSATTIHSVADAVSGQTLGADTTKSVAVLKGFLRNSTNAGNITLMWAQGTSDGTNTTVKAGSWIQATRVE